MRLLRRGSLRKLLTCMVSTALLYFSEHCSRLMKLCAQLHAAVEAFVLEECFHVGSNNYIILPEDVFGAVTADSIPVNEATKAAELYRQSLNEQVRDTTSC